MMEPLRAHSSPDERADPYQESPRAALRPVGQEMLSGLGPLDEMSTEIAQDWDMWSVQIGTAMLPYLEQLSGQLTQGAAVMACTSDGFNLCAVGLDDTQVQRLSALASSLLSVAGASADVLLDESSDDGHPGRSLDAVSLAYAGQQGVLIVVRSLIIGSVVLFVTAPEMTLGFLLVQARATAEKIAQLLGQGQHDAGRSDAAPNDAGPA